MVMSFLKHFTTSRLVIVSALIAISIGCVLLSLPIAQANPLSFIDVLFTTISVTTGTGLLTVSLHNFTPLGQTIIICLVQIGALGLITLLLVFYYLFFEKQPATELLAAEALNVERRKNLKKIIFFVIGLTAVIELLGALALFIAFQKDFALPTAIAYALFHSISAFSNAGISLLPKSMAMYFHNPLVLISLTLLMLLGGIGFITLREGLKNVQALFGKKKYRFSLGSKIVWATTAVLFCCAAGFFWFLESSNTLADAHPAISLLNAIFNGTASMGTGFATVTASSLHLATLLIIMIIAFIGTSPGSTGSGIKTTTIALFAATVKAVIFDQEYVSIMGKRIARDQIRKAIAIISLSIPWILFTTFCLLITEPDFDFIEIFFESVSSFATLGISTRVTPHLSAIGKGIVMISMILGRLGPFTLIFALKKAMIPDKRKLREERVLLS